MRLAQVLALLLLLPVLTVVGLGAAGPPAAQGAVPATGSSTDVTIGPGAYVVDMGQSPQTIANGLRPYGLVYDLVRNQKIPVLWAISNTKARDGVDFTAGGKSYSGGSFVIAPAYAAAAASTVATWRASGVVVDGPLTSSFTIPEYAQLTSWPRIVLDQANGSIAAAFYTNAGIPSSAYRIGTPAQLTPCHDLYVMPHADPTFATHQNLVPFNNAGGAIWAGCHAVSTLENIVNTTTGATGQFNFLSTHGLVPFGQHGNGSPPYQYDGSPSDPIMQFKGSLDAATTNGSEQIYLPSLTSAWRPTTNVLVTDPDQQNLVSVAGSHGVSNGPAAVLVYGRGFGNPSNGLVMYEAGHNINTGNNPASVAAQRAFLNFNLLVGIDRAPTVHATASTTVNSGQSVAISSTVSGGTPGYTYQWSSDCGGTFDSPTSAAGNWIAPVTTQPTACILRVVVTDQCGRVNFDAVPLTVEPPPSSGGIVKQAYVDGSQVDSVAAGSTITYVVSPTSKSPTNPTSDVAITDTASDGQNYVGGTLAPNGAGFTLTPPADGTVLDHTPLATWPAAPNIPSTTSGVAKFLYGENAQYGQTATVANALAYQAAAGAGYTPFIVHNTAGDTIVSAVNTNTATNNLSVTCTDITTNAVCTPTTAINTGKATPSWGNPVVVGTKAYFPIGDHGFIACLDYANTTPAPCTTNANNTFNPQVVQASNAPAAVGGGVRMAGVWTANGNLYLLGENGGNIALGCLTPATATNTIGTQCTGFPGAGGTGNSNGENIANLGGTVFVERLVVMGNGNVAFTTVSNNVNSFGVSCVHISGATVTNCSGGAVASLTATTVDGRALRPVVANGTVTGFCYGTYGAAAPTGCFDSSGAAAATAAVPMPASLTVSGDSAIPVPGTSQIVYSTGTAADQLQCFDYSTNTTCGTSTVTGQSVYGATFLPNTTCVISYGATNSVGWKVWDTAKQLQSIGPNCVSNVPTYTFSDPAPRYCGPGSGVAGWGNLTLTAAGVIGTGTVVTYEDTATGAVLATVTVTAAMGGGTTTVTIPKPAGVDYTTSKNLTVTVETPSGAPAAGTTVTATLANTTTGDALPQLCYQVRVPVCNISISNEVNANGVGAFTDSGAVGLNCLQPPQLTIVKNPDPPTITSPGQTVTYSFVVTNTGGLPASGISVTDTQEPPATEGNLSAIDCPQTTLTQHESMTCTATYAPTQADIDNGAIQDSAVATGTDPQGNPVTSQPFAAVVLAQQNPQLTIAKTTTTSSVDAVGEVIPYTFTVTNSGNITLFDVTAADVQQPPAGDLTDPVSCPATPVLAPGGQFSCTASYTVTQADLDHGNVTDTATASGYTAADHDPSAPTEDEILSAPATLVVPVTTSPALLLTKSADPTTVSAAGDTITYRYSVTNTGNVTITGVSIADPHNGLSALTYTWPGAAGELAPGQRATATATYTVTQADVDAGAVLDTAISSGTDPTGGSVDSNPASATVTVTQGPSLSIGKTADPTSVSAAGQTVTFGFTITNTGNVTLSGVVVDEGTFTGTGSLSALSYVWPGTAGVLAPGQQATATATYAVTQADVDAGSIVNTATASGIPPGTTTPISSAPSSVSVRAPPAPSLSVVKSATVAGQPDTTLVAGQVVDYSFVVTNTGNVTLSDVAVDDGDFSGSGTPPVPSCPVTTLAPGEQVDCTASYTVTQADVDAGHLTDTATASGTPPGSTTPVSSGPSTVSIPAVQSPSLSIQKTADPTSVSAAGDGVTFTFTITNTGNVTLTGVVVAEGTFTGTGTLSALTYSWPGTPGVLIPGEVATATATYTVTQADVDAGGFSNTATAMGTPPGTTTPVSSAPSTATVTAPATPALSIDKTADPMSVSAAGQTVTFSYRIENTGNVTLSGVSVADGLPGLSALTYTWPGAVGVLGPGQVATATATYTVTQADVDAGAIVNTATASGTPPAGGQVESNTASVTVTAPPTPALSIDKTAEPTTVSGAGETVTFSYRIENTGNVTLSDVSVTDGLPGLSALTYTWPGAPGVLAPADVATATATYTVTQADVDAGAIVNTATASGLQPGGVTPVTSAPSTATVTVAPAPSLTVVKSATSGGEPVTVLRLGQVIDYSFVVTNTGNVTLSDITVADTTFTGSGTHPVPDCPVTALAPGDQVTCTATYTVTQADVDAGQLTNTATASGTPPGSTTPVTSGPSTVTVPAEQLPALTIDKTADPTSVSAAGDTVSFSFRIENTGNVTLSGVAVDEGTFTGTGSLSALTYTWPGTAGVLAPGQVATATATYSVTQADVDAGGISNTATASGTAPSGTTVTSQPSTATVSAPPAPSLTVVKSATSGGEPVTVLRLGEVLDYAFVVTNTGNVTLSNTAVDDIDFSGSGTPPAPSCPVTTLAPGEQVTCTATYTVTQADVDAGQLTNTATASGTPPGSTTPVTSAPSTVTVPAEQLPALSIDKTADPTTVSAAGDTVTFSFRIENTGNVTLSGVSVTDALPGLSTLTYTWPTPASPGVVAPGQVATATAVYVVTQADVDAGGFTNTASASGVPPGGGTPVDSAPSTVTVTATRSPAVSIRKTADPMSVSAAGQTVTFSYRIENTGNVTLSDVSVTDGLPGLSALTYTWPGAVGVLGPGQVATATATYVVTQADVDAGQLTNTATASGTPPGSTTPVTSGPSTVTVPAEQLASLTVERTASPTSVSAAGETVTFGFTITNTGNVTLSGVAVDEGAFTGTGTLSALTYSWPGTAGVLIPGQRATATATYRVTQADVDAGAIVNTATASGTPPRTATPVTSAPSTVTVTATRAPALTVVKSATSGGQPVTVLRAGQVITYAFVVTNTGNVTLHGITVADTTFSGTGTHPVPSCRLTTLAPGEQVTCTATYTVTQADVVAGHLTNTATASGTPPSGPPVTSAPSTVTVPNKELPGLTIRKTADPMSVTAAGETVTFGFTITNTGNVRLTGVSVTDGLSGLSTLTYTWPGTAGVLIPGQVATATYAVTQADIDAGGVTNTATTSGTAPGAVTVVSNRSTVTVEAPPAPALVLVKSASPNAIVAAGDRLTYTFAITNAGNVTLTGVTVREGTFTGSGLLSAITYRWPGRAGVLAPGASAIGTATYVVTSADMRQTAIENTATAAARAPRGTITTSAPSTASTTVESSLPFTGTDAGRTVLGGLALMILGLATVAAERRRTKVRRTKVRRGKRERT